MLRISQIKRNAEKGEQGLKHARSKRTSHREEEIQNLRICKRSLDARKKTGTVLCLYGRCGSK